MPQQRSGIEKDKAKRGEDSEQRAANAWLEPRTNMVSYCFDYCNETIVKLVLIYVFFIFHMPQERSGIERYKAKRGEYSEQRAANAWREPRTNMVSYCFDFCNETIVKLVLIYVFLFFTCHKNRAESRG